MRESKFKIEFMSEEQKEAFIVLSKEYMENLELKTNSKDTPCMFAFGNYYVKEDKMEETRVVRKLEDLHNLENGMGLYIDYNLDVRVKNKNMLICYGNDLTGDRKDNYLEVLKAMGFKFEYKPLCTKEEVLAEMRLKCKEFEFECENYFIRYDEKDRKYHIAYDATANVTGAFYFYERDAIRYCNKLNEIIGVGK